MEPNSTTLLALLIIAAVAGLVAVAVLRSMVVRIVAGVAVLALAMGAGTAIVNDYYGYYQTWSQLRTDVSGSYRAFAATPVADRTEGTVIDGSVRAVTFTGARSGISRPGYVYLPPQYFQRRYARTRFPAVELLHGTPGAASDWLVHLDVETVMNRLLAAHEIGPMILVIPTMSVGHDYQECVDAPGALDDTYITDDVRHDVLSRFRASTDPAQWGISGYSSGGYCAANLALRHPSDFGAAAVLDGYFRPGDGPAAAALHHDRAAERANDPLLAARRLRADSAPLPSLWLSAGTGDAADTAAAHAFSAALHGVETVTLFREPGAGHNFYAWIPAVPRALAWMWLQLADPDLRVRFPIAGPVRHSIITALTPHRKHHGSHRRILPARVSGSAHASGGSDDESGRQPRDHSRRAPRSSSDPTGRA